MTIRRSLSKLVNVVIQEAERNPDFEAKLRDALCLTKNHSVTTDINQKGENEFHSERGGSQTATGKVDPQSSIGTHERKRPSNRRPPAVIDPVQLARESETTLRNALEQLNLEQLRDIVADYGMDTGKLVMKWRTTDRIINRIIEVSLLRAEKGDAFRERSGSE